MDRYLTKLLWIRHFQDLAELHAALHEFRDRYNNHWILERLDYRTPHYCPANVLALSPKWFIS
jgi:putative transposase